MSIINIYGQNCSICNVETTKGMLSRHHIIPRRYCKLIPSWMLKNKQVVLCNNCHSIVEQLYLCFDPIKSFHTQSFRSSKCKCSYRFKQHILEEIEMKFKIYCNNYIDMSICFISYILYFHIIYDYCVMAIQENIKNAGQCIEIIQ